MKNKQKTPVTHDWIEEALELSHARYRAIIEDQTEFITRWRPTDFILSFVNKALCDYIGKPYKELFGNSFIPFLPPEDQKKFKECIAKVNKENPSAEIEHRAVLPSGEIRWQQWINRAIFNGSSIVEFQSIGRDITERKQTEQKLIENERKYRHLAESVNGMVYRVNPQKMVITYVNCYVNNIFGLTPDEIYSNPGRCREMIYTGDRKNVIAKLKNLMETKKDGALEYRIVRKDNEVRWVEDHLAWEKDKEENLISMNGIIYDITERKKAEEILNRDKDTFKKLVVERTDELVNAQLELEKSRRLADIGTLAATIAHELRNPLAAIKLAAENIKRKQLLPFTDIHIANIEKKIIESERIINDLLSYSRIKAPKFEALNGCEIMEDCISLSLNQRSAGKKVKITKNLRTIKDKFIKADSVQLRELFSNILNNAIDALPKNGGKIEINAKAAKNYELIEFQIRDNGSGIDKEALKKIYDPFFTTKADGTGLGLTVCRQIVRLHNGILNIESEKGKGTTVDIFLPMENQSSG